MGCQFHDEEEKLVTDGNPDARTLQILVESRAAFVAFLRSHVGSQETAEDILQKGFLRAVEKQQVLESHENVIAWFYTVLRNLITDHFRSVSSTDRKHLGILSEQTTNQMDYSVLDTESEKAICSCVAGLIDLLSPQYADVIRRVDFNGEEIGIAAAALGISPGNLSVRLHRARQALKKSLVRVCGACAEHKCLDCSCKKLI